jgi:RIO kinase 1
MSIDSSRISFSGQDGWPAPKLKDAPMLDESQAWSLYLQLIGYMRVMFVKCKLIHADLSEFNLLLDVNNQLYVIDVSQSVEQAHPNALEFLRLDCRNVTDFFAKRYALRSILTMQQLFHYITDPTITDDNEQAYLDKAFEQAENNDEVDERVFERIFIPQTLDDFTESSSKDFRQVSTVLGMNETMTGARLVPKLLEESSSDSDSSSSSEDLSSSSASYASAQEEQSIGGNVRPRNESPRSKHARKQAVREAQREKRKNKIPKHVKKRAERLGGDKRKH